MKEGFDIPGGGEGGVNRTLGSVGVGWGKNILDFRQGLQVFHKSIRFFIFIDIEKYLNYSIFDHLVLNYPKRNL